MAFVEDVSQSISEGVLMPVTVSGEVVFVKQEKNDKGRHFKRLQLLDKSNGGRARLYDVTDMANDNWMEGKEVTIPVQVKAYQGRAGVGLDFTHWGRVQEGAPTGDSVSAPGAVGGGGKSGGKFGS